MSSIACRQKGNAAFARSDYASAITQYTLALAAADKVSDRQKLFSNRCVCILPGHLLSPALCPRSLGHNAKHVCSSGPPLIYSFLRILMLWKMQTQLCKLLHGELCHLLCAISKLHPVSHETCFFIQLHKSTVQKSPCSGGFITDAASTTGDAAGTAPRAPRHTGQHHFSTLEHNFACVSLLVACRCAAPHATISKTYLYQKMHRT